METTIDFTTSNYNVTDYDNSTTNTTTMEIPPYHGVFIEFLRILPIPFIITSILFLTIVGIAIVWSIVYVIVKYVNPRREPSDQESVPNTFFTTPVDNDLPPIGEMSFVNPAFTSNESRVREVPVFTHMETIEENVARKIQEYDEVIRKNTPNKNRERSPSLSTFTSIPTNSGLYGETSEAVLDLDRIEGNSRLMYQIRENAIFSDTVKEDENAVVAFDAVIDEETPRDEVTTIYEVMFGLNDYFVDYSKRNKCPQFFFMKRFQDLEETDEFSSKLKRALTRSEFNFCNEEFETILADKPHAILITQVNAYRNEVKNIENEGSTNIIKIETIVESIYHNKTVTIGSPKAFKDYQRYATEHFRCGNTDEDSFDEINRILYSEDVNDEEAIRLIMFHVLFLFDIEYDAYLKLHRNMNFVKFTFMEIYMSFERKMNELYIRHTRFLDSLDEE